GDGSAETWSGNGGAGGPTADAKTVPLRERQTRNFLATLLLSQGVPMLTAGDELGRTQGGNNNAYCLDDETSWLAWPAEPGPLLEFTRRVLRLRRAHPVFRRRGVFRGPRPPGAAPRGLAGLGP